MAPTLLPLDDTQRVALTDDYPHYDNWDLATAYNVSVGQIERFARVNGLRKDPARTRANHARALRDRSALAAPATVAPLPRYPSPAYCRLCGLSNSHWPGCASDGTARIEVAPLGVIRRDDETEAAA